MPHIEFHTFISQIFWLLLTFAAIYLIISKLYMPRVATVVISRATDINKLVAQSEDLGVEIKLLQREILSEQNALKEKVSQTKAIARQKANKILEEAAQKAQAESVKLKGEQEQNLQDIKKRLSKEVAGIADDIAGDIHARVYDLYKFNVTNTKDVV